ncbi:MAG: aminomethyl-transferring glycine dehydrogenase subunit GcvPB [Chloroflexi bacterium]|nr:aminomethyl-transferring glycine dehydrogenase subunit GcvPB [Chloroflexota bacterium]MCL5025501.1 aminomethyl-transferring glycine dehydrogenase subunit GcvPB [Chloroflexota bacterium]
MKIVEPTVFELSAAGRTGFSLPASDVPEQPLDELLPARYRRSGLGLPEMSEIDVVRHFTRLSQMNFGVDTNFYPLGSCTMKYNPKINEEVAALSGLAELHPYQSNEDAQGALRLMYELQDFLAEITGMAAVSLQPAAGAQGELTGMLMVSAYHRARGDARRQVLVPDSAHGTNPASAHLAGMEVVSLSSDARGGVDLAALRSLAGSETAAIMLTVPNTLGLLDENLCQVTDIVHRCGGLVYCDGANLNALLGRARLGDLGCDLVQMNLHKTFSAPHGGGGPGAGPVAAREHLAPFLPAPLVAWHPGGYYLDYDRPQSIGRMRAFHGNFLVLVKAYAYIRSLGAEGLRRVSGDAVLNANYLLSRVRQAYDVPYDESCMHEFVASGRRQKAHGVRTLDITKRLMDFGFHPPTVYFPLIVEEALMIEPTETESRQELDRFADALLRIAAEAEQEPRKVQEAPHATRFGRMDEVAAARRPRLRWQPELAGE